jgi:glycosyltransferase involved in cell wall biosynthesis
MEPPVDTERDNPAIDGSSFREMNGVSDNELLVVTVSRLALDLKLDALVRAIDAADLLAEHFPLKLILVGDGPSREALTARAHAVNLRHGRKVIGLPGSERDPRAAYAAADLVIGMGSSALRALAIGRPVVVQGQQGFSEIFEPATLPLFLEQGFYGVAEGPAGAARLASQIEGLLRDRERMEELGHFGRQVVAERFSLKRAVDLQLEIYRDIIVAPPWRRLADSLRSARLALTVEASNHHPLRKRRKKNREQELLTAAGSGFWPPSSLTNAG